MSVKYDDNSDDILEALKAQAKKALMACGLTAEGYAKLEITNKKAVDTGNLRNSITHKVVGDDTVYVGTNVHYAPYVEYGWGRGSTIGGNQRLEGYPARPYLKPAVEDNRSEYEKIIEDMMKR